MSSRIGVVNVVVVNHHHRLGLSVYSCGCVVWIGWCWIHRPSLPPSIHPPDSTVPSTVQFLHCPFFQPFAINAVRRFFHRSLWCLVTTPLARQQSRDKSQARRRASQPANQPTNQSPRTDGPKRETKKKRQRARSACAH